MCRLHNFLACLLICRYSFLICEGAFPIFTWPASDGSTAVTIDENDKAAGTLTLGHTLSATDTDNDTLTFTITSDPLGNFEIVSPARIQQKASAKFDFESGTTSYSITIQVSDSTTAVTTTLTVNINDVNDETPVITGTCSATIDEEQVVGTAINIVCTAADADNGDSLTYQLSGSHQTYFQVDSSTGQFANVKRLDFDASPTLTTFDQLTLTVTDSANHQATAAVTITLTDINDNTPTCNPSAYFASVAETATTGDTVTSLTCSDADSGSNAAITYSSDSTKFSVDNSSGIALKTTAPLDYETAKSYTVKVTMVDGGSPKRTGTATVFVTVTNANDNDPTWGSFAPAYTSATAPYDINENSPRGTRIVTAAATDSDGDAVTFSIVSVTANDGSPGTSLFRINSGNGELQTQSSLDRDPPNGKSYYDVIIRATDSGSPARSIDRTVRVGIADYNDNAPQFALSLYSVTITEGASVGTSVLQMVATDGDTSSTLAYDITNGNTGNKFEFDSTTTNLLQVKTVINLDASANDPDSYTLIVTVKDGGSPELTGTATVYVSVTSSNDHTPVFGATTPTGSITTAENVAVGTSVAKVTATDDDHGNDGVITYSIIGGDTSNNFQIDPSSGVISVNTPFAGPGSITLSVKAQDGGSPQNSVTTSVAITVSDVNNNSPVCTPSTYALSVAEDKAANYQVVSLMCSDADTSDTLTYAFTSGNGDSKFAVNGSGVITLASTLDYDSSVKSYALVVRVSDGTNNVDVPVSVTVTAVNEATPTFAANPTVTKAEDTAINSLLTTYTAADNDHSPHNIQTYQINSVTNSGGSIFSIDQTSGELKLAKSLDYDTVQSYEVVVIATDGGGLKGTGTVTVSVTDVNDNTPVCSPASWSLQTPENAGSLPVTLVSSLGCTDGDGSSPNKDITYSLVQTPTGSGEFAVSSAGVVTLTKALDFESASFYTISITAKDGGPSPGLSTVVPITVSVTDVNDGPPTFSGTFSASIAENVAIGTSVSDVVAADPDGSASTYGKLTYAITSGNTGNSFQVNPSTGRVTVAANLDRETTDSYALVITATEHSGDNTATATLTVTLTDINDNTPVCQVMTFSRSIAESTTAPSFVQYLDCSDADSSSSLQYVISSGDTSKFSISNGTVTLISALDFDLGTRKFDLVISVSDGTTSISVSGSVIVTAVSEATPVFAYSGSFTATISESASVGSIVQTVVATDADSRDTAHGVVTYSFTGGPYPKFALNPKTGVVTIAGSLDRDTVASYTIQVQASDGDNSASGTLTVTVSDENDNAPIFNPSTYSVNVAESIAANAAVVTVTATDADDAGTNSNGVIQYSISSGNTGSAFDINTSSGAITVSSSGTIDYETTTSHTLVVQAKDRNGGSGVLSSEATVIVKVTPVNEHAPVFTSSGIYTATVSEDSGVGTTVATVAANDADSGNDGSVFYSMPTHSNFKLDSESGNVILKAALDYETTTLYTLTITASDRGTIAKTANATLTITVTDANDNSPECTPRAYVTVLREDVASGSAVASLVCSDQDSGVNGQLTYSIQSGQPFQVNSTGALTTSTALDYESASSYSISVTVTDGGSSPKSTEVLVSVTVIDVNEHTPTFTGQTTAVNVPENANVGDTVATIIATDSDTADVISYSLEPVSTKFQINPSTGEIKVKSALDHETTNAYTLVINATDSGSVDGVRHATHTLTVTVTDSNDFTPVFNPASYIVSLSENTAAGTTVKSIIATDSDSGVNGDITYSITSGNTGNVFKIDKDTGTGQGKLVVDSTTNLDYETLTSYSLVVRATDGGGKFSSTGVEVTVEPYNEHTPTFTPSATYTVSILENATFGTNVTKVSATDADSNTDGIVTYSISSGANGHFAIDGGTGIVSVIGALDRETLTTYSIVVKASDGGTSPGQLTALATVNVNIEDVNDVTPSCSPATIAVQVAENSAASTAVHTMTCSDADDDPNNLNNKLVYSITSGNTGTNFAIDASTGSVTVASGASLDFEGTTSYSLIISVSDSGTPALTSTATLNIVLTGVNEHDPAFSAATVAVTVSEDAPVGSNVTMITANDADNGVDGNIRYSISSGNNEGKFQIDALSGLIKTKSPIDRETTATYVLTVLATDQGSPSRTASATVQLTVTDVNDNAPICSTAVYSATVPENAGTSTTVITVACTDADNGTNAAISYSIVGGNTGNKFNIDATTGEVKVAAALDCETLSTYSLTVRAADGGSSPLSNDVTAVIDVSDVNEDPPAFSPSGTISVTVNEAETVGYIVIIVNATDPDCSAHSNSVTYAIASGNTGNSFTIDPKTGVISLAKLLDRETLAQYTLGITSSDGTQTDSMTLIVGVDDANDETPTCGIKPYVANVAESATVGHSVIDLTCTDGDGLTVNQVNTYAISSGNTGNKFAINSATGKITLAGTVDYETLDVYNMVVTIADGGTPALTGTALATVYVTGVNEHTPVLNEPSGGYSVTVPEDTAVQTVVLSVEATDSDKGVHGQIRYSIVSGNTGGLFAINVNSGNVTLVAPLDRENQATYTLTVRATDSLPANSDEKYDEGQIHITVSDVNDNFPVFNPASYSVTVLESASVGSQLKQLTVTDDDEGINAQHTFSIVSGDNGGKFSLNNNTLVLAGALDYETTNRYTLNVRAVDGGASPLSADTVVVVNVLNENEFTPVFPSAGNSVTLPESTPVGSSVFKAAATDPDTGIDGDIRYAIVSGNNADGTPFFVDPISGDIKTNSYLDFDTAPTSYTLNITATDNAGQGANALASSIAVTLTLQDANDNPPVCSMNIYKVNVNEDASIGDTIVTLAATDADSGTNAQFTFSIDSGNGVSLFALENSTGALTLAQSLDYEQNTNYFLAIKVTDKGTPSLYSICYVKVTVVDVNDNPPEFTIKKVKLSLTEEQAAGILVGNVYAEDKDSGANADLDYAQVDYTSHFQITKLSNTQVQITTKQILDREQQESYTFKITATDKGNPALTATTTVLVSLDDINDNDPRTSGEPFTGSISEDSNLYTYVLTVNATDDDAKENGRVTFGIISGNDKGHFSLDSDSGILQTATAALDRETDASYTLVINVTDHGTPARSVSTTATVSILDINDNSPVFDQSSYAFDVTENTIAGTNVGKISATDADVGENAVLTYSFVKVLSGNNLFSIDGTSGEFSVVTPPDREDLDTHVIQYMVSDNGSPKLRAFVIVTFTILDRNDNNPVFSKAIYPCNVTENAGPGVNVVDVSASDKDLGENGTVTYSISPTLEDGTKAKSYMSIDSSTGAITTLKSIDRETDAFINFVVIANDQGTPSLQSQSHVRVVINDLNDNNPEFLPKAFYNAEIPADERLGGVIVTVEATDKDEGRNAELLFTFQTNIYFVMNQNLNTANITQTENQYPPANQRYLLNITATDNGLTPLSSGATIRIDTFTSTDVVVDFHLNIRLDVFRSDIPTFLDGLKQSIAWRYPNAVLKLYDSKSRQVVTKIQTTSRRLLNTDNTVTADYATASVYALCDNSTEESGNAGNNKCWLKTDELLSLWQKDSGGTPGSAITGTSSLEKYKVTSVHAHPPAYVTPWILTPVGIAVLTICCFLFLLIIIVIIILIICCKRKRPVTPSRVAIIEGNKSPLQDEVRNESDITDNSDKKKHPQPSVVALPMPTSGRTMSVGHGIKNGSDRIYYDKNVWHARSNSMMEDDGDKFGNQKTNITTDNFDRRAIDPSTGKMYEYNSKTNERRWVKSSDGHAVVLADRSSNNINNPNSRFSTPKY